MGAASMVNAPAVGSWSMDYAMIPWSVPLVRLHVSGFLEAMGWRGDVDDALLIVSELVSNAISHGKISGKLMTVSMSVLDDGSLVLDVSDPVGVFPRFGEGSEPGEYGEGGRGLPLVRALGARLSWSPWSAGGKTVRACVTGHGC